MGAGNDEVLNTQGVQDVGEVGVCEGVAVLLPDERLVHPSFERCRKCPLVGALCEAAVVLHPHHRHACRSRALDEMRGAVEHAGGVEAALDDATLKVNDEKPSCSGHTQSSQPTRRAADRLTRRDHDTERCTVMTPTEAAQNVPLWSVGYIPNHLKRFR